MIDAYAALRLVGRVVLNPGVAMGLLGAGAVLVALALACR